MELAKDRWDARNIPGLQYAPHTGLYFVDFLCIPKVFRPPVKEYARFLLGAGRSAGTLYGHVHYLGHFFAFFIQRYPDARTLRDLTEQDVTAYVLHLKTTTNARGRKNSDRKIGERVHYLEGLLSYLERIQSPMRPSTPTPRIIWPHHYPHWEKSPSEQVKYIPQMVLKQLNAALHHLDPVYIPIVILLRASGWRISDVLYLKIDTCLQQDQNRYNLVGDIQKTRILGHTIPITQDVAAVVLTQIEWMKQHYTVEENPHNWLFSASKQQHGRPSQRFSRGDPRPARPV